MKADRESKRTLGTWEVNTLAGKPFREVFCADVLIADTGCGPTITPEEIEANAEFIVLACNSHDDLLEALELMISGPTIEQVESGVDIYAAARGAINKARGN